MLAKRSILIVEDEPLIAMMLEDFLERSLDRIARPPHLVTKGVEEILEHHCDQRLILNDQDRTRTLHQAVGISGEEKTAKRLFTGLSLGACRIPRRLRQLGHREGLGQEIDVLDVDRLPKLLLGIA